MRQKKIFCKRLLTLVLSLAMVFTSVNFPVLDVQAAVENKYASTSETHGATYNEAENTVTFWINSEDADYGSTQMWFKGYDSYATAEKNHISEGGEFIAGLAPVNYTENAEQTQKTYTVEVEEGIGAYLYYFMPVVSGRPSLEHIIVIDEDAVPEETTPTVPGAVLGGANIVGQYWTTEDDNKGKIHLAWPNATGATSYEVSVDGKVAVASVNTNACFVDNIYTAGEHTVSIVGINDVGRGEAGVGSFTLTEEQAGVKADEGGTGGEGNEDGDQGGTGDGDQGGTGDGDQDGTGDLTPEVTYIVDPTVDLTGLTNNGTVNGWNTWTESAISVVGGPNSTVNITYPSGKCANDYALQFQTPETLSMTQGEYYTLTFKAQSSIPRYIEVCMGDTEAGYARYNDMIYKLPANQETEITYVFSGAATVDAGVKLQFLLGTTVGDNSPLWKQEGGHTLKISEVSLVASGSAETAGANIAVASDKAALSALITECNGLTAADYSEESYANLTASVTAAQAVVDNASATKAAADEALYNLQVAKASLEAAGTEEPELDPIDPSICVNLEDKKAAGEVTEWSNENAASYSYDGTAVTITSSASWDNDWQTQWALLDLPVTAGKWTVQYDITAVGGDKPAYSKIISGSDTPIVDTSYTLSADETKRVEHEFTVAEDCNVTLFFNLGNWGSATSLTISNVVVEAESPYVNLEEKKAEEGGVFEWCDSSTGATYTYDDETLTISATNWNWDWAVQWAVQGFDVTAGLWQFEFDIHSDVAKAAYAKVCLNDADAPLKETSGWNLVANETEHVTLKFKAEEASTVRLFLNLGNYGEPGTITISNVKLSEVPLIAAPALNVTRTTKDNGFVAGVENVVVKYTDDAEWRNAISAVIVNNKTLDASKYSTAEGTLTLDKSVTPKQGMYKVVVEATGYHSTEVTLPVYADDLADENWVLDWSDEFNGTKLDTTKWDYEIGIQSGTDGASDAPTYWGNEERQYYIEEAAQVKGGKLIITANAITDEIREKYNITDEKVKYTSSRLRTVSEDGQDLFYGTTYGRIEAKMELPHGTGYWPAFWALPTNETIEKYGAWASSGELDIMEAVGQNANYVNGTIHYGSTWPNNVYSGGTYNFPEGQSIEGAHVYAVEWEPGEIRWYVDDVLYHVENNWYASAAGASADYSFPAPFDEDFYLLLNLAVSGNYVGNVEPGEDELGKSMKVDYVRVYKDTNADYDAVVDAPDVDKDSEFFEANKVNAGDDGNYIKDPEFTTLANHALGDGGVLGTTETPVLAEWYSAINSGAGAGAQGTASVAERDGVKYAKIDVTTAGSQAYNVQLIQHVPLAKGYTYRLTFDAYTDKAGGRNFSVAPKGDGDNGWVGYDTGITANLTEEVKSFEYIFTMAKDSDPTARIEMNLGNTTGAVYVGNVRLVALSQAELDQIEADKLSGSKDPLTNGEHIYNGAFDQGDGRFVYWQTEGDYTVDTSNRTMYATIEDTESIDDVRLIQPGIQLQALDTYKLTLDASAAAEKTIKVGLYSADGDAYAENTYTIGTETSTVTLDFTMPKGVTDMNAVLAIAFGGNTTAVEIDNVSMMRLTNNSAEWDAALLYPLGGETWSDYVDYEFNPVNSAKPVPADGVVVENMKGSTNNYDYMIYKEVSVKTGYTYNLSYDIKTSVAGQKIVASVQQDQTWVTFAEENITTTTEYQTINKQFTATTEGAMMLKFCLSDSSNKECEVSIANVKLTVVGAPYVTVTNAPETMPIGSEVVLNATYAVDVNPQYEVFEYASDNTAVVAVNGSVITALAAGTATITVTSGTGAYTSFTVTVSADAAALEQADVTDLQAARAEYVSINNDDGKYTSASYNVFNDIFMDIDDMLDAMSGGLIYSQDAVDALLADLIAAYEALELAATADDITALTTAISEADTYVANAASYTAESYAAFEKALNAAKELANADECSKADVEKATAKLEAAIEALETVATEDDATELNEAIAAAEEHLDIPYYTADSYAAFEKAYNKAVVVAGDLEAGVAYSSEDIQKVTTKLNDAVEGLTEKEGLWIEKIEDQVYTGSAIKPTVVVWDGATCLDPKKDYKVSYKKNINVGEATITVTGKGNYAKKDTFTFDIVKKDIENLDATDNEVIIANVYTTIKNNKVSNPKVTAKYGKKTMKLNKDYTVTYPEIPVVSGTPVAGDYEIVIKGIGNYTGVTTINYEVRTETVLMSKAKVKPSTSIVTYAGEETVKPTVTVTIGGVTLTEWNGETGDYTVDYTGFDQIGKATVTVTAVEGSKYYGSKSVKYTVKGNTLSKGTMTVSGCDAEGYPYTGEEIKIDEIDTIEVIDKKNPLVDVSGNEMPNVLTKGVDYEITYSNNTNVGKKATMTITGINAYAGTLKTTFKITALNLNTANVEGSDLEIVAPTTATYTKTGAVPEYSITYKGEELQFKKDYTMKVSNNKKAGNTATIILTGKGNFTGTFSWTYNVEKPAVEDIEEAFTITATDVLFNKNTKAEKLSSKITVVENETGKKLAAKTDYVKVTAADYYVVDADGRRAVAQSDLVADQIIYVDVTLTGNYEGTLTTSFRLYDKKMSSVYVAKIGPEIYTGSEIEPEVKVYVDKAMTTPLDEAYYEVSYNKNVTKGTAKVTITGVGGGYGGTKTVTFKINAEDMNWAEEAMKGIASFFANLFN